MYTKTIQNTKFVYILYTNIVQIKVLYGNECTRNAHQIPAYIQKMCKSKNGLKLEMYVFCTYKQYIHYTKPIQLAN